MSIKNGLGGYSLAFDHVHNNILLSTTNYDPTSLVDSKTGLIDSSKLQKFVSSNQETLKLQLPRAGCEILGIQKGRFY